MDIVQIYRLVHRKNATTFSATGEFTLSYAHSLRPERIADIFFSTETLQISGSQVTGRGGNDLLADYFGLSTEFQSEVSFDPVIKNAIFAWDGYINCDNLLSGLYGHVHIPFVYTVWDLRTQEIITENGQNVPFPPRYMDVGAVNPTVFSWIKAMEGGVTYGQMQEPLKYGRFTSCKKSKTSLSDIQMEVGWDFIKRDFGICGVSLRASAPVGTRPEGELFFEPIIGNGHHWELGIGIYGQTLVWEKDGEQELNLVMQINAMHLFKARQRRNFDIHQPTICNTMCQTQPRFMSRYMLVKEFDEAGNYINSLSPLINHTTLDCYVQSSIQLDATFMLAYTFGDFSWDFGYNLWFRAKESITLCGTLPYNRFGLKGIQNVADPADLPSPLTQSTATIFGNNFDDQDLLDDPNSPVFINTQDIDKSSAQSPRTLTHKLFMYGGNTWYDAFEHATPFFGMGGSIEFEGINSDWSYVPDKNTMAQWSLWLKVGALFR